MYKIYRVNYVITRLVPMADNGNPSSSDLVLGRWCIVRSGYSMRACTPAEYGCAIFVQRFAGHVYYVRATSYIVSSKITTDWVKLL